LQRGVFGDKMVHSVEISLLRTDCPWYLVSYFDGKETKSVSYVGILKDVWFELREIARESDTLVGFAGNEVEAHKKIYNFARKKAVEMARNIGISLDKIIDSAGKAKDIGVETSQT